MSDKIVKLAAIGDIALTHSFNDLLSEKGPEYPFSNVVETFKNHNIVVANLEAPISNRGEIYPLKCSLRTDPEFIAGIKNAGIKVVSLANNHILDYGEDAFYDTLDILKNNQIGFSGAGKDLGNARKPFIALLGDIKIGFLSYCDVIIDSPFYASDKIRGIAPLDLKLIEEDIFSLRPQVDILIVSLHWGIENWSYPTPTQKTIAHKIVNLGCDLILGHHPHVLQGYEKFGKGYIFYSLGNFIFPDISWVWKNKYGNDITSHVRLTKDNRQSVIVSFEMSKTGINKFEVIPCYFDDLLQIKIDPHRKSLAKINRISRPVKHNFFPLFWKIYVIKKQLIKMAKIVIEYSFKLHKIRWRHIKNLVQA